MKRNSSRLPFVYRVLVSFSRERARWRIAEDARERFSRRPLPPTTRTSLLQVYGNPGRVYAS